MANADTILDDRIAHKPTGAVSRCADLRLGGNGLAALLLAAGVLLLGGARGGLANPSPPDIPPHRH